MRPLARMALALAFLGPLAAGCGGGAKSASSSKYLLDLLHQAWLNSRQALQAENPNLNPLGGVHRMLQRSTRRARKGYSGPNKEDVLARLAALQEAYEKQVASKLDLRSPVVQLRRGATVAEVKAAFMALDKDYRQIEAMIRGPQ